METENHRGLQEDQDGDGSSATTLQCDEAASESKGCTGNADDAHSTTSAAEAMRELADISVTESLQEQKNSHGDDEEDKEDGEDDHTNLLRPVPNYRFDRFDRSFDHFDRQ